MRIVLLGAPGAGKGTYCKKISARYGVSHLSSGDILRKERSADSELGREAQEYMDSGALVPDALIVKMMAGAVRESSSSGYVLDGFPRTVSQAVELDELLAAEKQDIDAALNLVITDEVVFSRMTGRRSCPKCGAVYHLTNLPPKADGLCDNDGTELIQRPDDELEVVKKRLETYHRITEPVSDYYRKKGIIYDVEADKDVDEVCVHLFERLDIVDASAHRRA